MMVIGDEFLVLSIEVEYQKFALPEGIQKYA